MHAPLILTPVGRVRNEPGAVRLEIDEAYADALSGLAGFSHIIVCWWFDRNDTPADRSVLQVHPRGDPRNPLTGVFATHAPKRPNLVAISLCRLLGVERCVLRLEAIDAFDGSPVIDVKGYIPCQPPEASVRVPDWV